MEPFADREENNLMLGVAIGIAVMLMLVFVVVFAVKSAAQPADVPLDSDEIFMKAQFCIQTGRIPVIVATQVTCDDYRHGHRREIAP
jgi:hypothetical protein